VDGKMSALDTAAKVLTDEGRPMSAKELIEAMPPIPDPELSVPPESLASGLLPVPASAMPIALGGCWAVAVAVRAENRFSWVKRIFGSALEVESNCTSYASI
jgi:hypothetical protein